MNKTMGFNQRLKFGHHVPSNSHKSGQMIPESHMLLVG